MMHDAAVTVLFYAFGAFAILAALIVVNSRRLLRAAVALMFVLMASAGLYLLLSAEFLAGVQVLVYVGGIVVLIVFAVMLTSSSDLLESNPPFGRKLVGAAASIGFLALSGTVFAQLALGPSAPGTHPADDVSAIGTKLLDFGAEGYLLPFEVISLLLLAAVIGGIAIARKTPPQGQPFTSGGDLPGEADARAPRSQRDEPEGPHA
jgi:NADH-quinone oxidoreductase subunit J